jgi:hypothetical protein
MNSHLWPCRIIDDYGMKSCEPETENVAIKAEGRRHKLIGRTFFGCVLIAFHGGSGEYEGTWLGRVPSPQWIPCQ